MDKVPEIIVGLELLQPSAVLLNTLEHGGSATYFGKNLAEAVGHLVLRGRVPGVVVTCVHNSRLQAHGLCFNCAERLYEFILPIRALRESKQSARARKRRRTKKE